MEGGFAGDRPAAPCCALAVMMPPAPTRSNRFPARVPVIALALLAACLLFAIPGCGEDSGSSDDTTTTSGENLPPAKPGDRPPGRVEALAQNFPPPDLTGLSLQAQAAVRAGQSACRGKTPKQVRDQYLDEAISSGGIDRESEQGEAVSDPSNFEFEPNEGPSFAAGQLAASVYAATLPPAKADLGFQGCVRELAVVQVRRMRAARLP